MRLVNLAHGDFIVMGAYLILLLVTLLGLSPFIAAAIAAPFMFAFGYGLQKYMLNRTLGEDILPPLLVTFGLSIMLQNACWRASRPTASACQTGALSTASIEVGGSQSRRHAAADLRLGASS
jgi:branched-chain amino acid transport system permease protein